SLGVLTGEPSCEVVRLAVPEEPLATLADLVLRRPKAPSPAETPAITPPTLERAPLPRPPAATVTSVESQVREALRAGRLEDALAAVSLLVPDALGEAGALVALDPMRRLVS